ncbi:putative penicillin-binding protein DacB1 [Virgisporangium aliadipatigenens]|uniref:Putative penicillin-binding protein DacB1 n=1 Tax=Virgisporangium aliadipatigenens TaxID=741659 RepID=A0A8J3YGR8_9ACTN|nr:putative penicillin-binding protein DacB1 [Virgisporangium aliadipatigenens]
MLCAALATSPLLPAGAIAAPDSPAPVTPCPYASIPSIPPTPAVPPAQTAKPVGGEKLGTTGLVVADGAPTPPTLSAVTWIVADLDSGAVVGACGPHVRRRPASTQKLLLAAAALPLLDPNLVVEATEEDVRDLKDGSAVGLVVGGKYPVSTLWYGLLLQSGNDAANALARVAGGAGGVAATVERMNAEAKRLGALDTHAANPHGYDAPDQASSAYDLALIARADFAREDFVRYDTLDRMQWPAQPPKDPTGFQIQNENQLLVNYPGAMGGKTGFTDEARHTYVGAAQRDGRRLVVTLMGAEIVPGRTWKQAISLLDWGFAQPATARVGHLVTPEEMAPPPSPSPQARSGVGSATAEPSTGASRSWARWSVLLAGLAMVITGALVIRRRVQTTSRG